MVCQNAYFYYSVISIGRDALLRVHIRMATWLMF